MQREFGVVFFCLFSLVWYFLFLFFVCFLFFLVTANKESVVLQPVLPVAIYKET